MKKTINLFKITVRIKTKSGDFETLPTPPFKLRDGSFGSQDVVSLQIYHGEKGEEVLVETLYLNHTKNE